MAEETKTETPKLTRVGIVIPKRPEYGNAYYALQRKFDSGTHVVEVDAKQLAELRADPVLMVIDADGLETLESVGDQTPAGDQKPPEGDQKPGKPMKR